MWWGCCWRKMEDKYTCQTSLQQQLFTSAPEHVPTFCLFPECVWRGCPRNKMEDKYICQTSLQQQLFTSAPEHVPTFCLFPECVWQGYPGDKMEDKYKFVLGLAFATALYPRLEVCVCVVGLMLRQDGEQVLMSVLTFATALYLCTLACTYFLFIFRVCMVGLLLRQDGGQVTHIRPHFCNSSLPPIP